MDLKQLGERVAAARVAQKLTKEQAARDANISSITWKRVEDGRGVRDVSRAAVLEFLGLDDSGQSPTTRASERAQPGLHDASDVELLAEIARRFARGVVDAPRSTKPEDVEEWLAAAPLSVVPVEVLDAVAAHEEEGSIAGEQEQTTESP